MYYKFLLFWGLFWQMHSQAVAQNHTIAQNQTIGPPLTVASIAQKGFRSVVYFANWVVYDRRHVPSDLPIDQITHINYAFANISVTGKVAMSDPFIDLEKLFPGDSPSNRSSVFGCVNQFNILKRKNRQLKVLLSIGGSDFSVNFPQAASTVESRALFAQSAVQLVGDLGFDGIDINWQGALDDTQASNFVTLLQETRTQLSNYSETYNKNQSLLLTASCSARPQDYNMLQIKNMDQYLDFWNLVGYNFSSEANITHHQSNLYASDNTTGNPWSVDQAVEYYTETAGLDNYKLVLGMPLFGMSFANTSGLGFPTNGFGGGSWELGTFDYRVLPQPLAKENYDGQAAASWSFDEDKGLFVTYDNVQVTKVKAKYIKLKGLGGGMWWESSADGRNGSSLITTLANEFTGGNSSNTTGLESSQNLIVYPTSNYTNVGLNSFLRAI